MPFLAVVFIASACMAAQFPGDAANTAWPRGTSRVALRSVREVNGVARFSEARAILNSPRSAMPAAGGRSGGAFPRPAAEQGPRRIRRLLDRAARHYRVSPRLVRAVARQESDFLPRAVSAKGAMGVMQLMPETARELRVSRPFNAAENIDGGVRFLRDLLARYHGNRRLALAAYNAGPEAVDHYRGVPPYPETRGYVRSILAHVRPAPAASAAHPRPKLMSGQPLRSPAGPRLPIVCRHGRGGRLIFSNTG